MFIEVSDTGTGMKPEDMGNLFQLFGKAKDRNNMNRNGTGLGLHICKQIVESMGGKIEVKSKYGEGTSFTMWVEVKMEECESISPSIK